MTVQLAGLPGVNQCRFIIVVAAVFGFVTVDGTISRTAYCVGGLRDTRVVSVGEIPSE